MRKDFNYYVRDSKNDIYVYIIFFIILIIFLFIISVIVKFYYILILGFLFLLAVISKFDTYYKINKIKKYLIDNKMLNKIGYIDFWNEKDCFFTEKYIIVYFHNDVYTIDYNEIIGIYYKDKLRIVNMASSHLDTYMYICTDKIELPILVWTSYLVDKEYKDLGKYLLNKNPKIKTLKRGFDCKDNI